MNSGTHPREQPLGGSQVNVARDQATQYVTQAGDVHVHQGGGLNYRVEEFRWQQPSLPVEVRQQPSRLLAARYQVVDFTGRDHELDELAGWRDDPKLGMRIRLIHGPGGQGKTRLASQFAQRSAESGWMVVRGVYIGHGAELTAEIDTELVAAGLLVIVDYAERWPLGDLRVLVQDPLLRIRVPVRILLLARSAGWWWDSLGHWIQDRLDIPIDKMALTGLADTRSDRAAVFAVARDRFAELLEVSDPRRIAPPIRLGEDVFGLVLTVHMAALVAVDAQARGLQPPADPAALSAYLLRRERDHWVSMFDNKRIRTPPPMLARAVFVATLTGPLPYPAGVAAMARAGIPRPEYVIDDHRCIYPPSDSASVCEPLYPDRLGEDFLALQAPGRVLDGPRLHPWAISCEPDPWADTAVARLLDDNGGGLPDWTASAVTALIETARRWPHVAHRQLGPLLRERPQLALAAGGIALARMAELPDLDLDALEAIEAILPTGRHVDLDIAAAAVTTRLATQRLGTTLNPTDRAQLYHNLANRLALAGQREQALDAINEAVEIYRLSPGVNPASPAPDRATEVTNLGNFGAALATFGSRLSDLGRHDEALEATRQGVKIYRDLVEILPDLFEPNLATALNNLLGDLSRLGRHEEALNTANEAVQIYRRLANTNQTKFEPKLALGLTNYGIQLSDLGHHEEALEAISQAVAIRRRLAQANPAAFEPDFALSLSHLSSNLSRLGRHEEALEAASQAVAIRRRLAQANPAAFEPDLALALGNHGNQLWKLARRQEALDAMGQAVEIYRRLARDSPAAFERDFTSSLTNLSVMLSNLGLPRPERHEAALEAASQAVAIRRRLAQANPAAFEPDLALALTNLSVDLWRLRRSEEAVEAASQAVAIRRRLAEANPAAFEPDFASSLSNLSGMLSGLGRHEEALDVGSQAMGIYRRLAGNSAAECEPDFAVALTNRGVQLSRVGRHEEALEAAKEAIQIQRRLAETDPVAFGPDLASSLSKVSLALSGLGRHQEASVVTGQAVEIYRGLVAADPATLERDFALTLINHGHRLSRLGRHEEALEATSQAVAIRRRLAEANPAAFEPDLAQALWVAARVRVTAQIELPQALAAAEESVTLYEGLTQKSATAGFTEKLRNALATLATVLDGLGRGDEAADFRNRIESLKVRPLP